MKPMIRTLTAGAIAAVCLAFGPMLAEAQRWGGNGGAAHTGAVPDPIIPADGTQNITGSLSVDGGSAAFTGNGVPSSSAAAIGNDSGNNLIINVPSGKVLALRSNGANVETVATGSVGITGAETITGASDVTQLKVIGNGTQTTVPFQVFQSDGTTNVMKVSNGGTLTAPFFVSNTLIMGLSQAGRIEGGPTQSQYGRLDLDNLNTSTGQAALSGNMADGASAIGVVLSNRTTLANAAAKLVSFVNNATEKAAVLFDGTFVFPTWKASAAGGVLIKDSSGTTIANFADSITTMVIGRAAADQNVQFPGGINVGNSGSTVKNHSVTVIALDFPNHGPADQSSLTVSWGGSIALKTTDSCQVTANFGSQNAVNQCYVSTAGGSGVGVITVLEYCLNGAAGTCNTASKNYYLAVDVY